MFPSPYRGSSYFYICLKKHLTRGLHGFRPLSGFFLFLLIMKCLNIQSIRFPSPIGVFLFLQSKTATVNLTLQGFRPLSGFFLFLRVILTGGSGGGADVVSVPYRGSSYFYAFAKNDIAYLLVCFRPLSGFFLFLPREITDYISRDNCFRPLSGFFLFLRNAGKS